MAPYFFWFIFGIAGTLLCSLLIPMFKDFKIFSNVTAWLSKRVTIGHLILCGILLVLSGPFAIGIFFVVIVLVVSGCLVVWAKKNWNKHPFE